MSAVAPLKLHGNTVYTHPVAKVMISIPDDLLQRVDAHASAAGETRSGFLQRLAERELERIDVKEREEFERLLDSVQIDLGGRSAAELIREDRETH
ncbi:MAG TPA: type II toxin-antitoxin system HicB family antitoxin [Solirubrobacterales bacterium]